MTPEERKLMMAIAKKQDDLEKKPWYKRLEAEEAKAALAKMTQPDPATPEPPHVTIGQHPPKLTKVPGEPLITMTFFLPHGSVMADVEAKNSMQEELRAHIKTLCREHGILRLTINYEAPGVPPMREMTNTPTL